MQRLILSTFTFARCSLLDGLARTFTFYIVFPGWLAYSCLRSPGSEKKQLCVQLAGGLSSAASRLWHQLRERAEKIPGERKLAARVVSRSYCVRRFNTAPERPCQVRNDLEMHERRRSSPGSVRTTKFDLAR
jgi:hypothetical protein